LVRKIFLATNAIVPVCGASPGRLGAKILPAVEN
jgi:hypothetical protein